ncbi:MAG: acyl-CoA thioesterase, partial [Rubritepida sp.]|nr:acyl-CoA thioesterase [Rubritepida sp.]
MDAPEPSFTHTRALTIEWGDCDPAGIVFYPRYFAFFDASTAALFSAALGMPKIAWRAAHGIEGIPMVDTRGRFLVPCAYGDAVTIESRIARFGRSSFDV